MPLPFLPSLTAEAVCLARALEARRPADDRLVHDPYARLFLRRPTRALNRLAHLGGPASDLGEALQPGLVAAIAARHGWIDAALERTLPDVEQVLILGAGYDSRGWRLPLDGRLHVEIDHPATARRKQRKARGAGLAPPLQVTTDLAREPLEHVLLRSPLRSDAPTAIVWEGVSMYLDETAVLRTLTTLRSFVGPRSHLLMDLWARVRDPVLLAAAESAGRSGLRLLGEPIRFELLPVDAPAFLERAGWTTLRQDDVDGLARLRVGRPAFPFLHLVHASPAEAP